MRNVVVKDMVKSYGRMLAVDRVSFEVREGEMLTQGRQLFGAGLPPVPEQNTSDIPARIRAQSAHRGRFRGFAPVMRLLLVYVGRQHPDSVLCSRSST